jgi:hypothetical protein
MVLQGQGSRQHVEHVPSKVLFAWQNQCPTRKDIKFPVDRDGVNP